MDQAHLNLEKAKLDLEQIGDKLKDNAYLMTLSNSQIQALQVSWQEAKLKVDEYAAAIANAGAQTAALNQGGYTGEFIGMGGATGYAPAEAGNLSSSIISSVKAQSPSWSYQGQTNWYANSGGNTTVIVNAPTAKSGDIVQSIKSATAAGQGLG